MRKVWLVMVKNPPMLVRSERTKVLGKFESFNSALACVHSWMNGQERFGYYSVSDLEQLDKNKQTYYAAVATDGKKENEIRAEIEVRCLDLHKVDVTRRRKCKA